MCDWTTHHLLLAIATVQLRSSAYADNRGAQHAQHSVWVLQADMSPGGKPRNDRDFWGSVLGSDAIEQHDQQASPSTALQMVLRLP